MIKINIYNSISHNYKNSLSKLTLIKRKIINIKQLLMNNKNKYKD